MQSAAGESGGALLERDRELGAIREATAAASAGDGVLVVVDGVAGAGKSRLLAAAAELAAAAGMRVLSASCGELEQGFPFGVALQLFESAVAAMTPDERAQALSGSGQLAGPLFGEPAGGEAAAPPGELAFPVVHGLYWLTASMGSGAGAALLVDDANWCDEASLRFIAYLSRRLDGLPAMLVIAVRGDGETARARMLAELYADPRAVRLRPAALSEEAVTTLVRERVAADADANFCTGCAHATGGNPFLVHELLAEIVADGLAADAAGAARVERLVPESVLRAVIARIARLPEGSAGLARAAAILGDGAELEQCARLAELDVDAAGRAADALVGAGVFDLRPDVAFAHPLIRSTVAAEIPDASRGRAHQRAAQILHELGERDEAVAAHLLESRARVTEGWAIEALRVAARGALAAGEPQRAVALLRRARAQALPSELRGPLLAELGQAQALAADPDALDTLDAALVHTTGGADRSGLRRRRGDLLFALNRPGEAVAEYDRGVAELGPDSPAARELLAARAVVLLIAPGAFQDAPDQVATIIEREGEDTPAERGLLAQIALSEALTGQPRDRTRALALRAWADGALLEDEGPDGHVWSLVTGALSFAGFLTDSIAITTRVIEAAQQAGSVLAFATASYSRSGPLYWHGQIVQATADAQRAFDAREDGWSAWLGSTSFMLSGCLVEREELEQAEAVLADPDDPRWAQSIEGLTVLEGRAWLHLVRGRNADALADYLALGERCENTFKVRSPLIMPWHSGAALAAVRLKERDRAAELNAAGSELAEQLGAPGPIGRSRWIAGLIEGGEKGLHSMREAVELLDGTEAQLEYAYALIELGAALRRANQRAAARQPLSRARELAHELGALALESRATSELRAAGARPRRIMRTGADALTPSERRIADYAAGGLTNRQIAETLFITTKAVEFHLANAYRKLDIERRHQLAGALAG